MLNEEIKKLFWNWHNSSVKILRLWQMQIKSCLSFLKAYWHMLRFFSICPVLPPGIRDLCLIANDRTGALPGCKADPGWKRLEWAWLGKFSFSSRLPSLFSLPGAQQLLSTADTSTKPLLHSGQCTRAETSTRGEPKSASLLLRCRGPRLCHWWRWWLRWYLLWHMFTFSPVFYLYTIKLSNYVRLLDNSALYDSSCIYSWVSPVFEVVCC